MHLTDDVLLKLLTGLVGLVLGLLIHIWREQKALIAKQDAKIDKLQDTMVNFRLQYVPVIAHDALSMKTESLNTRVTTIETILNVRDYFKATENQTL